MRARAGRRLGAWLKDAALTLGVALVVLGALWLYQEATSGERFGWRSP